MKNSQNACFKRQGGLPLVTRFLVGSGGDMGAAEVPRVMAIGTQDSSVPPGRVVYNHTNIKYLRLMMVRNLKVVS